MSDPAFVPNMFGRTGLTPTVGLGIPLYVIHATFVHPVSGAKTKVPAHHWVLFDQMSGTIVSASKQSDANGVCVVNDVADPGQGALVLGIVPAPTDVRNAFLDADEAWIDLDTNDWASPPPDRTKIDRRNLYRIPAWTTLRKSKRGGGFESWPDKASSDSRQRGTFMRDDVLRKPFGTLGTPWEIPLDFGWVRATVTFSYFDWGRDKQNTLPPGLFLDVVPSKPDSLVSRLGSGTAVKDGDGSMHLMIESEPTRWWGFQFLFRAPPETRVDLAAPEPAAGAKDTRLTADAPCPSDPNVRNKMPPVWHSLGHRGKATIKSSGKLLARNSWIALSSQLQQEKADEVTIDFHLDDVQLCKGDSSPRTGMNGRPGLFDHWLTLLDPVKTRPHLSDTTVDSSVLPADKVYTIGQHLAGGRKRLEASTRLIHLEGAFFDLRDERVNGTVGTTPGLGARAAVQNAHPNVDYGKGNPFLAAQGMYQIHLIDVPGVTDPLCGQPLAHMLIYLSCKIDEGGLLAPVVDQFYALLTGAAERWSQGSPGVPRPTKDYRIVAKDPSQRNSVIRPRFYFGQVFAGGVFDRPNLQMTLKKGAKDDRSNTLNQWWLRGGRMEVFDGDIAYSANKVGPTASDSDGVPAIWQTVAHEFGHAMALPDEYGEELSPSTIAKSLKTFNPRVLGYDQPSEEMPTDYRPFYGDRGAIMEQNSLPRLRHYWHHVEALNQESAFASLVSGGRLVIRHEGLGGGLQYVRPLDEKAHPYTAVFSEEAIPGGRGKCALFPVGEDEGVAEAMFGPAPRTPLPPGGRPDGILVVRSRVRFRFDSSVNAAGQWKMIWNDFIRRLYDPDQKATQRFMLQGGAKLARIAIVLQPLCDVGMAPFTSDDFELMVSNKLPVPPNPFAVPGVPQTVNIDLAHFDAFCVLRALLGVPTYLGAPGLPNKTPLGPADFVNVARLVDGKMGDGAHVAVPI